MVPIGRGVGEENDLLETIDQPAFGQVIGRKFNCDFVPSQDPDIVATHLAGDVSQNDVAVFKFNLELGVGQRFNDSSVHLNGVGVSWSGFSGGGLSVALFFPFLFVVSTSSLDESSP